MYLILHTLKAHRGTYLVGEITEQSIKVFTQATSARLVIYVAARLYIILNKSALSFKLMMNYYI